MNFYGVLSPVSVYYWILFRPITENDYHTQKKKTTTTKKKVHFPPISSISRPSLLCLGFDVNQSQGTKPISMFMARTVENIF